MADGEQVLVSRPGAPWLPAGGRADVVLARGRAAPPRPTCLVRLLATRGPRLLTVERPDGKGPDLPTLRVGASGAGEALSALTAHVLGRTVPAELLGYVRNVVPGAPAGYPWPTPDAYFVVWHCAVPADLDPQGAWLPAADAEPVLGERHWWPLARHAPGLTG